MADALHAHDIKGVNVKSDNVFLAAVIGIAGYVLWKLLDKAADFVSDPIADAIIKFTLPEPVNVNGAAILPNGTAVSMSKLSVKKVPDQEVFYFDWNGKRYQLGPRSAQGNWPTRII